MVMNKSLQIATINRALKRSGIEPDTVDVYSLVDSDLTLRENSTIIRNEIQMNETENEDYGTKSLNKLDRFLKIIELNDKRTNRQKSIDFSKTAKNTFYKSDLTKKNFEKWKSNPNRYDVEDIDANTI